MKNTKTLWLTLLLAVNALIGYAMWDNQLYSLATIGAYAQPSVGQIFDLGGVGDLLSRLLFQNYANVHVAVSVAMSLLIVMQGVVVWRVKSVSRWFAPALAVVLSALLLGGAISVSTFVSMVMATVLAIFLVGWTEKKLMLALSAIAVALLLGWQSLLVFVVVMIVIFAPRWCGVTLSFVATVVSIVLTVNGWKDIELREQNARFDYAFLTQDWDWIEAHKNDTKSPSLLRVNYIYLAEAKTGVLCDRLFSIRHNYGVGALLPVADDVRSMMVRLYIFDEIGAAGEAHELAELMAGVGCYDYPFVLKGGKDEARRFDKMSDLFWFYHQQNPQNALAAQYLLAYDLVGKNISVIMQDVSSSNLSRVPNNCQEAVIMQWLMNHENLDSIPLKLDTAIVNRYYRMVEDREYHILTKTRLDFKYGDTFWRYVF